MHQCQAIKRQSFTHYTDKILTILKRSYQSYEGKCIRFTRQQTGISVFRRDLTRVIKSLALISKYTTKRYQEHQTASNSAAIANYLPHQFNVSAKQQIIVADLSYIGVNQHKNYLCVLLNLSNRQIAGYRVGQYKTAD
ncbi:hypothetical protein BHC46_00025 [Snodgrassella alvi]|jgi:transposase InsO family protein|uniref:Uncharacterized protein n=1 Tax=Snodgrassella alvi TaxID=1196083 RepID=A0A2N9XQ59_9NEIS|nr:hypothetical protein [Snodgrassella alvi]PIT50464.1 hypothetical protein BHC46_00025 [Snodgrassella alvi]